MYIPDPLKIDVIRFLDSAAGKALLAALEERKPGSPDVNLPHSTKLSAYDKRAGYEAALADLKVISHESKPEQETSPKRSALYDPRD